MSTTLTPEKIVSRFAKRLRKKFYYDVDNVLYSPNQAEKWLQFEFMLCFTTGNPRYYPRIWKESNIGGEGIKANDGKTLIRDIALEAPIKQAVNKNDGKIRNGLSKYDLSIAETPLFSPSFPKNKKEEWTIEEERINTLKKRYKLLKFHQIELKLDWSRINNAKEKLPKGFRKDINKLCASVNAKTTSSASYMAISVVRYFGSGTTSDVQKKIDEHIVAAKEIMEKKSSNEGNIKAGYRCIDRYVYLLYVYRKMK